MLPVPANAPMEQVYQVYNTLVVTSRPNSLQYLWDEYKKKQKWIRLATRTKEDYEGCMEILLETFGKADMSKVRTSDFAKWRDKRAIGGVEGARKGLMLLRLVIAHAVEYETLGRDYVNQIAPVTPPEKPTKGLVETKELMTKEMFFKILEHSSPEVKVAASLSYITGLRLGDTLAIKKTDINPDGTLNIKQNKTGTKLLKSATTALLEVLEAAHNLKGHEANMFTPYLIPNTRGRQYTVSGFGSMWLKCKKSAFPGTDTGAPIGFRTRFHDIRHRGTTDFDGKEKYKFTGHTGAGKEAMSQHYNDDNFKPIASPSLEIELPQGLFN